MIIAVTSLKGGVGKTTSAVLLAEAIAQGGRDAVLLDADPERSAKSWELLAERGRDPLSFEVVVGDADALVKQARGLAAGNRIVVIDTPPNDKGLMMSAAGASDLTIVPLAPTRIDLDRMGRTVAVLEDMKEMKPNLNVRFLLTMYSRVTVLSQVIGQYMEQFAAFDAKIRHLERYRKAFGTRPDYLEEYAALWAEVREELTAAA